MLIAVLSFTGGAGIAAALFFWLKRGHESRQSEDSLTQFRVELQREMGQLRSGMQQHALELSRQMNTQLAENTRFLEQTHQDYRKAVGQMENRLGELQEATRSMIEIGKDISSLEDILKAPKLRGGFGELILAELLRQVLPPDHFSLQYSFRNGLIVDAVILLADGMVPVDAKFPLENFKRILQTSDETEAKQARKNFISDVKKHIDAIASKYILPQEGTFEFALMYVPAENVYYEIIIKEESAGAGESLTEYALRKKVLPVSPNSFYAYLQAIARGLRGLRIERSARMILESLGQLDTDFKKCAVEFEKIGTHLMSAQSAYDRSSKKFEKIQDKLSSCNQGISSEAGNLLSENEPVSP